MAMDDKELGIEYFKALRSEIDLRIRNNSYLTISKIVACGALFGHLAAKGFITRIIAVPIVAIFLDLAIHHNVAGINSIGKYIRDELEKKCFKDIVVGKWNLYESSSAQTKGAGLRDLLDRFGQIGITIAFFLLCFLKYTSEASWDKHSKAIWAALLIALGIDIFIGIRSRASGK
jgi:hypothetical protein